MAEYFLLKFLQYDSYPLDHYY